MQIYELRRCEEYWMQESWGLFATKERALQEINPDDIMLVKERDNYTIVISIDKDHYSKPTKEKFVFDEEMISGGFAFYDLEHKGFAVWGIVIREVIE